MRIPIVAVLALVAAASASVHFSGGRSRGDAVKPDRELHAVSEELREAPVASHALEQPRRAEAANESRTTPSKLPARRTLDERVDAVVRSLALELAPNEYDGVRWTTRLHAAASDLGGSAGDTLRRIATDPARASRARVTACELLRVIRARDADGTRAIDGAAVDVLRSEVHADVAAERRIPLEVSARSLAAWGDALDLRHLLDVALGRSAVSGEVEGGLGRADALAALPHSGSALVAHALARAGEVDALVALEVLDRESGWCLGGTDRLWIAEGLDARLCDPSTPEEARLRALTLLGRFDRESAQRRFLSLAIAPSTPARIAHEAARRLENVPLDAAALLDGLSEPGNENALPIATALAPAIDADVGVLLRDRVSSVLQRSALDDSAPGRRADSVHALGKLDGNLSATTLAESLRSDPDAAVRAAAVVALRAHPDVSADLLREIARSDPSPAVRRLCEHELARARRRSAGP